MQGERRTQPHVFRMSGNGSKQLKKSRCTRVCEVRRLFLHLFRESCGAGAAVQRAFLGPLSSGAESGALLPPEFRIAANCCSCLRELTPSFS